MDVEIKEERTSQSSSSFLEHATERLSGSEPDVIHLEDQTQTEKVEGTNSTVYPQLSIEGDLHIHTILQCAHDATTCQFSDDGSVLAIGLRNGSIKIYSMDSGKIIQTLRDIRSVLMTLPVTSIQFKTIGESSCFLLATYACGSVRCWYWQSGECVWWAKEVTEGLQIEEERCRQSLCLSISPSGEHVVTGGTDSVLHLYDISTNKRISTFMSSLSSSVMDGHHLPVFAVTYHPERNTHFISGGWDNTIQFWDTREKHAVRMIYGPHLCGDALEIDQASNHIISGSCRKNSAVEFWDYIMAKKLKEVPEDPNGDSEIYTCHWLGPGHIIAAGRDLNMLKVIDRHSLTTESRLHDLSLPVVSSSVCPSGKWEGLIAATTGDRVFLMERGPDAKKRTLSE